MTLKDLLIVLSLDDYIGIWDTSRKNGRYSNRPSQQQYQKIGNIPWEKLRNVIDYDVLGVNHTEKGYLVRLYKKDELERSLNNYDLATKLCDQQSRRN